VTEVVAKLCSRWSVLRRRGGPARHGEVCGGACGAAAYGTERGEKRMSSEAGRPRCVASS
jgi:hypothetical protein